MKTATARPTWADPAVVEWTSDLLDSYYRWFGHQLITERQTPQADSTRLFGAVYVVVSQDAQRQPFFNYANYAAQQLWQMDWSRFLETPSTQSAEQEAQADRQRLLAQVAAEGCMAGYRGIRITSTGRRFEIRDGRIWKVLSHLGEPIGVAAMFCQFDWL